MSGAKEVPGPWSDALGGLLALQRNLAMGACNLFETGAGGLLRATLGQTAAGASGSCCDIPEPCWMPRSLGEFDCTLCPGAGGSIRLRVTNEDIRPITLVALASGAGARMIGFTPNSLSLGPKERGELTAVFTLPADAATGARLEALLWLRGCRDHYLRWCVQSAAQAHPCCHEIELCDGPDHVLHWYDHFYCTRPCFGGGKRG